MMLENKVALVTGGTSGIGRATAIALGAAGVKVRMVSRLRCQWGVWDKQQKLLKWSYSFVLMLPAISRDNLW